jgi:transposase InsO family protein
VQRVQERFGVSERRACRVAGQHRSTQRKRRAPRPIEDAKLRGRLRALAREHPRWGYKMAARIVRREGWSVNRKRIQRLWRDEGLKRPPPRPCKRRRVRTDHRERLTALRPNHVWAIDFQFDETADQRRLKLANIVDEYTREALAMRVGRSCTAEDLLVELDRLVDLYGAPSSLRCDNGPELIAWTLRDWCRLSRVGISYIEPGSPWETPYVESFNGRVRDELLNIEDFATLLEAQVIVEAWRVEYNTDRPHSALRGLTPAEVRAVWTTQHQPALS